jgi:amino acid transporter
MFNINIHHHHNRCNITSSALYVVALTAKEAGKYTPFVLIFIGFLLYLFRFIYSEVVFALPVNGGTYNLLRVVAGPKSASFAGMLTMLSYVTTAVISSVSGAVYLKHTLENPDWFGTSLLFLSL